MTERIVAALFPLLAMACWSSAPGATPEPIASTATGSAKPTPSNRLKIWTTVVDDATGQPIRDALVAILRPGVDLEQVDLDRLDKQVLSRGSSDANGVVYLAPSIPVPGTYSVVVIAAGYEPLLGRDELHLSGFFLPEDTSHPFDPWGKVSLHRAAP